MSDLSWLFKPTYLCDLSAENSNKMTFSKYALACWDAEASLEVVMPLTFSLAHADRRQVAHIFFQHKSAIGTLFTNLKRFKQIKQLSTTHILWSGMPQTQKSLMINC